MTIFISNHAFADRLNNYQYKNKNESYSSVLTDKGISFDDICVINQSNGSSADDEAIKTRYFSEKTVEHILIGVKSGNDYVGYAIMDGIEADPCVDGLKEYERIYYYMCSSNKLKLPYFAVHKEYQKRAQTYTCGEKLDLFERSLLIAASKVAGLLPNKFFFEMKMDIVPDVMSMCDSRTDNQGDVSVLSLEGVSVLADGSYQIAINADSVAT